MRKYVIVTLACLLLVSLFTSSARVAQAAGLNEPCGETPATVGPDGTMSPAITIRCDAPFVCNISPLPPGPAGVPQSKVGKCALPTGQAATDLIYKCRCKSPGDRAPGANGFACAPDINAVNLNDVAYCKSDEMCVLENDMQPNNPDDILKTPGGESKYPGKVLFGAKCVSSAVIANCKCAPGAAGAGTDKQNKMDCTLEGDPSKTGTAFCGSTQDRCYNVDSKEILGGEELVSQESGPLFDEFNPQIQGVACKKPEAQCTCKHPERPGSRINGFTCIQDVGNPPLKNSSYCDSPLFACIQKDPGYTMQQREDPNIFNDAPLKGIECEPRQPSPPPPPPCAEPLDNLGKCLAFDSAFGKISTDAGAFLTSVFALLLSFSGAIALLLIMRAGYILLTSAGNPERVKTGQDQLIAAIVGLLFIIFSFVILQVIGVEILKVPGFAQ